MTWSSPQLCHAGWCCPRSRRVALALIFLALPAGIAGCQTLPAFWPTPPEEDNPQPTNPLPAPVQVEAPKPVLPMAPQEKPPAKNKRWEWTGTDRQVTHIWIDVDSQKARFYEGTKQVGWTYIASGIQSYPTPVGQFAVMGKEKTKESNLYGKIYNAEGQVVVADAKRGRHKVPPGGRFSGAKMPYFLRLTHDGIGLHAGPIPRPGHPASHGCVRLPPPLASKLFAEVPIGTPVTITGSGPDYGDYQTRLAAKGPNKLEPPEGGTLAPSAEAAGGPSSMAGVLTQAAAKVEPAPPSPATAVVHPYRAGPSATALAPARQHTPAPVPDPAVQEGAKAGVSPDRPNPPAPVTEPNRSSPSTPGSQPSRTNQPLTATEPNKTSQPTSVSEPNRTSPPAPVSEPKRMSQPSPLGEPNRTSQPIKVAEPHPQSPSAMSATPPNSRQGPVTTNPGLAPKGGTPVVIRPYPANPPGTSSPPVTAAAPLRPNPSVPVTASAAPPPSPPASATAAGPVTPRSSAVVVAPMSAKGAATANLPPRYGKTLVTEGSLAIPVPGQPPTSPRRPSEVVPQTAPSPQG